MQWYYIKNGRQGPVEVEEIHKLLEDGTLNSRTKVWHAGMGSEWKRVGTMPEFGGTEEEEVETEGADRKSGLRFSTSIRKKRDKNKTNISRGNVEFASVSTVEAAQRGASFLVKLREKARWWYILAGIVFADFLMMHFNIPVPEQMGILAGFGFLEYAYDYAQTSQDEVVTMIVYFGAPLLTIGLFALTGRLGQKAVMWIYLLMTMIVIADMAWLLMQEEWVASIIHAMVLHPIIIGYTYGKRYNVRN